jgi:hypothetical protein
VNATNQQLAFARVQAQAGEKVSSALAQRAHRQAAIFQLHLALEAYATELLESAKLNLAIHSGPRMFGHLLAGFTAAGKASPELVELADLEQDPSSWLSQLYQWFGNLVSLEDESHRSSVLAETTLTQLDAPSTDSIALIEITEAAESRLRFSSELFREVIKSATILIERQRGNSQEY